MSTLTASEKISRLRESGVSGSELSRVTGLSQPTISRIERGQQVPKEPAVRAIDSAYDQFLNGETRAA